MSKLRALALFVSIAIVLVILPSSASADECRGMITVTIKHLSSLSNSVTVIDAISETTKISGTMDPHEEKPITICKSDAGYGRIKYKKKGQKEWTESSLLRSGDTVTI